MYLHLHTLHISTRTLLYLHLAALTYALMPPKLTAPKAVHTTVPRLHTRWHHCSHSSKSTPATLFPLLRQRFVHTRPVKLRRGTRSQRQARATMLASLALRDGGQVGSEPRGPPGSGRPPPLLHRRDRRHRRHGSRVVLLGVREHERRHRAAPEAAAG
jgi:hypothetical protein